MPASVITATLYERAFVGRGHERAFPNGRSASAAIGSGFGGGGRHVKTTSGQNEVADMLAAHGYGPGRTSLHSAYQAREKPSSAH